MRNRLVPVMLLKLPIMLWSNVPEFCLLCSNYAPYVSQYAPQIQRFLSVILHVYHYVCLDGTQMDLFCSIVTKNINRNFYVAVYSNYKNLHIAENHDLYDVS